MAQVVQPSRSRSNAWGVLGLAVSLALAGLAAHTGIVIVDWDASGARRLAVISPGAAPWVWAGGLVAVATALALGIRRFAGVAVAHSVRIAAPLGLLSLWAVPALPVLPDRWPMLLLLGGPLRWAVALVAIGLVLWRIEALRRLVDAGVARVGPAAVVVAGLMVFVGVGTHVGRVQGLDGDEPHYLMIAQSLLADGNLAIENNYTAREFAPFAQRELRPPFLRRGLDGTIYSVHAPGLPVLLLPAYALAGARGAVVFLGLVAALTALGIYLLARDLAGPRVALAVWAGVALGTPFLFHGWLIYPEMPAAFVTSWAALWLMRAPSPAWRVWMLRGLALAVLPWLHAKFAVLTAGLGAALGLSLLVRRLWAPLVALSLPVAASTASWFAFFWVLYGVADPTIPYGGTAAQGDQLASFNVPRGVLGLLFDQEYGLLVYSPLYALAPVGLGLLVWRRESRWGALALVATTVLFVVSSTRYYMWWGGASVPARFLIPVLPLVAPGLALTIAWWRGAAGRGLTAGALLATLLVAARLVAFPNEWLMFNERDGSGKFVEYLGQGSVLVSVLPSFLWREWQAQWPGVAFVLGVLLSGWLAAVVAARRPWQVGPAGSMVAAGLGGLVGATLLASPLISDDDVHVLVREGRYHLLEAIDARRTRVVDFAGWRRVRPEEALAAAPLVHEPNPPGPEPRDLTQVVGPIVLPPGRYDLQVWLAPNHGSEGTIAVTTRRGGVTLSAADVGADNPLHLELGLPREIRMTTLWVTASDSALADAIERVDVRPTAIVPRAERGGRHVHMLDRIEGSAGAYYAHLDRFSFPEGGVFWTRGEAATDLLLYPGRARRLLVGLQAGPVGGTADVDLAGERRQISLGPGERQTLEFDLPGVEGLPLRLAFDGGFRPSEVEPGSTDARWLGMRVWFELLR